MINEDFIGVFQLINALQFEIDRQDISKEEKENLYDYASFKMYNKEKAIKEDYIKFKLANKVFNFIENEIKRKWRNAKRRIY